MVLVDEKTQFASTSTNPTINLCPIACQCVCVREFSPPIMSMWLPSDVRGLGADHLTADRLDSFKQQMYLKHQQHSVQFQKLFESRWNSSD